MTQYQLKRRAIQNFKKFNVPKHVQRHYQRQWLHWVNHLGDRWLLAQHAAKGTYYV